MGLKKKNANNHDTGLRINQLNTRMTANYTVKHKLNRSQKLNCYFKKQPRAMTASWAPFLRGSHPPREINQTHADPQKCKTRMITTCRLERGALCQRKKTLTTESQKFSWKG